MADRMIPKPEDVSDPEARNMLLQKLARAAKRQEDYKLACRMFTMVRAGTKHCDHETRLIITSPLTGRRSYQGHEGTAQVRRRRGGCCVKARVWIVW